MPNSSLLRAVGEAGVISDRRARCDVFERTRGGAHRCETSSLIGSCTRVVVKSMDLLRSVRASSHRRPEE
eukprot:4075816-Prymnesium_polylepis.1